MKHHIAKQNRRSFSAKLVAFAMLLAIMVSVIPTGLADATQFTLNGSSEYSISELQNYIYGISPSTSVSQFTSNFSGQSIQVLNSLGNVITGSSIVATGSNIRLMNGTSIVETLIAIVGGDVDCDGKTTANDYATVKLYFKSKASLTGARFAAADADRSKSLTSTDYIMVRRQMKGTFKILQKAGSEMLIVPNVIGSEESYANTFLSNAGFVVSIRKEYNSNIEAGLVISQTPQPDEQANAGTTITLVVSLGKNTSDNPTKSYNPINFANNMKAIWLSQFDTMAFKATNETAFRSSATTIVNNCVNMGVNTIFVQVRPNGDSYYPSNYYPWSKYVFNSNTYGSSKGYDPFKAFIDVAHARGVSVHAWINPIRLMSRTELQSVGNQYQIKQWYNQGRMGSYLVECGSFVYLNPYYDETRQLVINGVKEICENYNVDGVHLDDYFYPTTETWFDANEFAASGMSDVFAFRRNNFSKLIRGMYDSIKGIDYRIIYGISPAAEINKVRNRQCADVTLWCSTEGYIDYIMPQLYLGFNSSSSTGNFMSVAAQWANLCTSSSVKVYAGLPLYKAADSTARQSHDGTEFAVSDDVIKRMIQYIDNSAPKYKGICLYSYGYIASSTEGRNEVSNLTPALKAFSN